MKYYYLPSSLSLSSLFPAWSFTKLERAKWLISCIVIHTEEQEPTRLSSRLLLKFLTTRHYSVIKELEDAGVINVSERYSAPIHKSKAYLLTSKYFTDEITRVPIQSKHILTGIEDFHEVRQKITESNWTVVDSHIQSFLNETTFEADEGRQYAETNYTGYKLIRGHNSITNFEARTFRFFKPKKEGRLYYTLTSMPKEMRRFLRYQGEPLWEADLKCFWPSCLAKLSKGQERDRLEHLIAYGKFYEFVAVLINKPVPRKVVKQTFCKHVLFTENRIMPKLKRQFSDAFPQLMQEVAIIKEKGASQLEEFLNKLEASIVFPVVENMPFAMTVHDSIVTTAEYIDATRHRLENRASEILGIQSCVEKNLLGIEKVTPAVK